MKNRSKRPAARSQGSALLIVLAFLLLLTTLTVAYLSRATFERQLSNASFGQAKVDLAGQGAISAVIGDLQLEIVAGSTSTGTLTTPTLASGYYYPNASSTVVPCNPVGFTQAAGLEDLLKISYPTAFYVNTGTTTIYNTTTYPAPNRASSVSSGTASLNGRLVSNARWNKPLLLAPTSSSNYAPTSSNFVAPDWIYVARDGSNPTAWNSSYEYLPSIAPTTTTGTTTPGADPVTQRYAYAIYDEGSTLDLNVAGSPISTATSNVGSYSNNQPYKNALTYADLLQLPNSGPGTSTLSTYLASTTKDEAFVNAIVGWRNFASAGLNNSYVFPNSNPFNYITTTTPPTGTVGYFDQNIIFNPSGFLTAAGYNPNGNSALSTSGLRIGKNNQGGSTAPNQSDNAFASRQQLLQFFLLNLGQNSTFLSNSGLSLTNLVNLLPYLGTFSRDINQPSYASPVSFANSTAPTVQSSTFVSGVGGGGNSAYGGDTAINPAFLAVTVGSNSGTSGWTRNNGTTAIAGEPLVKKRFALMRLAWLTYAGPSYNRKGVKTGTTLTTTAGGNGAPDGADYDIYQMENTYGIPASFLAQGTPQNIYNYFGLSWVTDPNNSGSSEWVYSHTGAYATSSSSASILTTAPASSTATAIKTLTSVAGLSSALAREPDFFEILKAGLCVGSIGKAYTASYILNNTTPQLSPADYYGMRDQDVDNQIIQIGANIISQYQPSGYPARILFNDGLFNNEPTKQFTTSIIEHRGVVDLPYIYEMREAKIRTVDSTPAAYNYVNLPVAGSGLTGNGTAVALQEPAIWNPHAWTTTSDNSDGNPRPTNFRIYAETCDPTYDVTGKSPDPSHAVSVNVGIRLNAQGGVSSSDDSTAIPLTPTPTGSWTAANTAMTFSIPQSTTAASDYNYLFREPTLLCTPGIPTNSSLAIDTTSTGAASTIKSLFGVTSIPSLDAAIEYPSTSTLYSNKSFLGFVVGSTKLPLAWKEKITVVGGIDGTNPTTIPASPGYVTYTVGANATTISSTNAYATYRLQYKDINSNWITYDEKYTPIPLAWRYNPWGIYNAPTHGASEQRWFNAEAIGEEIACVAFDPRTGRFGGMNIAGRNGNSTPALDWPPFSSQNGWAAPNGAADTAASTSNVNAANQNAFWTARPDENQGFVFSMYNVTDSPIFYDTWYGQVSGPVAAGWYPPVTAGSATANGYSGQDIVPGLVCQNNMGVYGADSDLLEAVNCSGTAAPFGLGCFADPDGVVRRGMAAYVPPTSSIPASTSASGASAASGIPLKEAYTFNGSGSITSNTEATNPEIASRPIMLNRPFRSVADIGHVFSDTPWRNLDFSTPESGNPGFLDIFCINDTNDPNGLVAGKVNLNTRQAPVLQAVLAGAYKDAFGTVPVLPGSGGTATADVIAKGLVSRTTGGTNLVNIGDLVGKWSSSVTNSNATSPNNIDGSQSYIGFSGTSATTSAPSSSPQNLSSLLYTDVTTNGTVAAYDTNNVNRMREVAVRALANCGTTRVWNLMIDVIAQTGRFPTSAASASTPLAAFVVEGERRYWVHVAIDRFTGKVLDEQVEEVKE